MKETSVRFDEASQLILDEEGNDYTAAGMGDTYELLEAFESLVAPYGLELLVGYLEDDNVCLSVRERK